MYASLLAVCLMLCVNFAQADQLAKSDKLLSEDLYFDDIPRVITVSRLSQPLSDSPSAVTIIDKETIRASGVVDLPDVFRLVPGFYVGTNAGYIHNTNPVVSYHGMTSSYAARMQVLIDGRTVYEPLYGGVQWSELPIAIADIERIEVTRGPNAASYGANSFNGVINIITQHPNEAVGSMISTTYGQGRKEAFYRHAGKLDDTSYRVTLGYREDDGLKHRVDFKRTRMLTAHANHRLGDHDELELQFGVTAGDRDEGEPIVDSLIFLQRTKQIDTNFQLAKWSHSFNDHNDISIKAYRAYSRSDDFFQTTDLSTLIPIISPARLQYDLEVENERYELEAQHTFSPKDDIRIVWGANARQDRTKAPFYLGTDKTQTFNLQQLFGHVEWHPIDRLVLNAGAMMEHNDFTGTDTSPRVSANFTVSPGHTLRAGISTATRTPSYLEEKFQSRLTATTVIPGIVLLRQYFADSGGLAPERIVSREIGYLGSYGDATLDLRVFDDKIRDVVRQFTNRDFVAPAGLILVPNGFPFDFTNGGDVTVRGFEAQAQWRIQAATRVIANYAKLKLSGDENELERYFLDSAPSEIISAILMHRFNQAWDASLAYYHTSRVTMLGDGNSVDATKYWNARLARGFTSGSWKGEIAANVHNLFDEEYQEFVDYNTVRRRAYVTLRLDF